MSFVAAGSDRVHWLIRTIGRDHGRICIRLPRNGEYDAGELRLVADGQGYSPLRRRRTEAWLAIVFWCVCSLRRLAESGEQVAPQEVELRTHPEFSLLPFHLMAGLSDLQPTERCEQSVTVLDRDGMKATEPKWNRCSTRWGVGHTDKRNAAAAVSVYARSTYRIGREGQRKAQQRAIREMSGNRSGCPQFAGSPSDSKLDERAFGTALCDESRRESSPMCEFISTAVFGMEHWGFESLRVRLSCRFKRGPRRAPASRRATSCTTVCRRVTRWVVPADSSLLQVC